jgi:RNA polymerase sigma-70 factor (ECF subfamily)
MAPSTPQHELGARVDPRYAGLTAEEVALRAQRGGCDAFAELVARYEVRLYNFLLRRVGSRSDAEDLTQETFIRAWERISSYDSAWRFSTWLYTIGARLAVSQHRKRRITSVAMVDRADAAPQAPDTGEDRSLGARLWRLAETVLGEEQHTALWLRYAEDLSIAEIAKVMRKSQVGVRVCLFRARQTLAQHTVSVEADGEHADATDGPRPSRAPSDKAIQKIGIRAAGRAAGVVT